MYKVKDEYVDKWFGGNAHNYNYIEELELYRLSKEWGVPVEQLETELEYVDGDVASEICYSGLFRNAVAMMDDEIREKLHADLAPCSETEFLTAYMDAHLEQFGEAFIS